MSGGGDPDGTDLEGLPAKEPSLDEVPVRLWIFAMSAGAVVTIIYETIRGWVTWR
jgi:hypothetical protein